MSISRAPAPIPAVPAAGLTVIEASRDTSITTPGVVEYPA